jgi:hypothetical protein
MIKNVLSANLGNIKNLNELLYDRTVKDLTILKLNKMECRTENNNKYKIIQYDKDFLTIDMINSYGLCKSIIINCENKVIGFAPPKSISADVFITKYPEINN